MREITQNGRARRHARWRRSLAWTTVAVAVAHAVLLALLAFPDPGDRDRGEPTLIVVPMTPLPEPPARRAVVPPVEIEAEGEGSFPSARPPEPRVELRDRRPAIPIVVETPGAPEETTIPSTALESELAAPTLPLEAGPEGIRRRAPRPETLARMRAESVANARLADLPGARRQDAGPVRLANGGVTISIPWQGFLPESREDETWRAERCRGKESGKSDKPGESEAKSAQCG